MPPALPSASDGKGRRARDGGQCYRRSSKSASRRRRGRLVVVGGKLPLGEAAGRGPLSARAKREPATFTARPRDGVCWTPARSGAVRRAPGGPGRGNARQVRGGRTGLGRRSTTPRQRSDARACYMGQSRGRGMLRRRSRCQPHHRRPPGEPGGASRTCDGRPLAAPGCNSGQLGGASPSCWQRGGGRDGATAPLSHAGGAAAARTARLRLSLALAAWDGAAAPLPHAGGAAAEGSARMRLSTALAALDGAVAPLPRAGGAAAARRGGGRNGAAALPGGAADGAAAPPFALAAWDGEAAPLPRAGGAAASGTARLRLFLALAAWDRMVGFASGVVVAGGVAEADGVALAGGKAVEGSAARGSAAGGSITAGSGAVSGSGDARQ